MSFDFPREPARLSKHPANAWIDCPDCNGDGKWIESHTDPERESHRTCSRCYGYGEIADGIVDPLVTLAKLRTGAASWRFNKAQHAIAMTTYGIVRKGAMRPVKLPVRTSAQVLHPVFSQALQPWSKAA